MAKKLKRSVGNRPQRIRIYVFCEGKNTEPEYFKAYEKYVSHSRLELCNQEVHGVPVTLYEHAKRKKDVVSSRSYQRENGEKDQVWIVFDRDEHPNVQLVLNNCRREGIGAAFSNPCFEVWLILHKENYDKDEHRHATQEKCERTCSGYNRNSRKMPKMSELMPLVEEAEARAISLEERRKEDHGTAPLTTAYKLTKAMRGL